MKGRISKRLAKALSERDKSKPLCKGWNYHIYTLGASGRAG